jgi:hypothetical protein
MIAEHHEKIFSDFEGTIIDIETIGDFDNSFGNDSRRYRNIVQVILGYIDRNQLHIYYAKSTDAITELKIITPKIIADRSKPLYAFNSEFEACVFFHHIGLEITFGGELNSAKFEKKKDVVRSLKIPNYDDPFFDDGFKCMLAWQRNQYDQAIAHNRACLLKERDILLKRHFRKPDKLTLVNER